MEFAYLMRLWFSVVRRHNSNERVICQIQRLVTVPTSVEWIGVTFRLAKTYLQFRKGVPYLVPADIPLRVATDKEKHAFFRAKGQQNANDGYEAPVIDYTLSIGDTLPPVD